MVSYASETGTSLIPFCGQSGYIYGAVKGHCEAMLTALAVDAL